MLEVDAYLNEDGDNKWYATGAYAVYAPDRGIDPADRRSVNGWDDEMRRAVTLSIRWHYHPQGHLPLRWFVIDGRVYYEGAPTTQGVLRLAQKTKAKITVCADGFEANEVARKAKRPMPGVRRG